MGIRRKEQHSSYGVDCNLRQRVVLAFSRVGHGKLQRKKEQKKKDFRKELLEACN